MPPTEKQVRYTMFLLASRGFDTRWMGSQYKQLGATMRERRGHVESWVRDLDIARCSQVIEQLRNLPDTRGWNDRATAPTPKIVARKKKALR